jgi:hypothetical protein
MRQATICVEVDDDEECRIVEAWLNRWSAKIRCSDNQGCGCCVDIWQVEAPQEALNELPAHIVGLT